MVQITGTTLGRIGAGYVYADWYPQITWTTPGIGPIGAKIGIMSNDSTYSFCWLLVQLKRMHLELKHS